MKRACCFLLGALCLLAELASAQGPDSKGKDFYLTFLPNLHVNAEEFDSLRIFVVASQATNVTITRRNKQGQEQIVTHSLSTTDPVWQHIVPWRGYELDGVNAHVLSYWLPAEDTSVQTARVAQQYFRVQADQDVEVYALSQAITTSDAFLVLPVDVLGIEYRVMSFQSDGYVFDSLMLGGSTPSQFAVLATDDSTLVEIEPSVPVVGQAVVSRPVLLGRGESFLVQARLGAPDRLYDDLTGSRVRSSKPVVVIAGHQRAKVPAGPLGAGSISRDMLLEQMTPVGSWGRSAFVIPFPQTPNEVPFPSEDLYRVLAAVDSTVVSVNGVVVDTLEAGQYYQADLTSAARVSADRPIQVAMFKKSSSESGSGDQDWAVSDPFMLLAAPQEQYMNSYRFVSMQANDIVVENTQIVGDTLAFFNQFATLVFPTADSAEITVDTQPLSVLGAQVQRIPGTGFSYSTVSLTDGRHDLQSTGPVGLYVYGYGRANSYGYLGGQRFELIDGNRPLLSGTAECGRLLVGTSDSLPGDRGLVKFELVEDLSENVRQQERRSSLPDYAWILLQNQDLTKDARATVRSEDSLGQTEQRTYEIPGFTVAALSTDTNLLRGRGNVIAGQELCRDYAIANYGRFPQRIDSISLGREYRCETPTPFTVAPGGSLSLRVCFRSNSAGVFPDTLRLIGPCGRRDALYLLFSTIQDNRQPQITRRSDSCAGPIVYQIADSGQFQSGIDTVYLDANTSSNVRVVSQEIGAWTAEVSVQKVLRAEPAVVHITATDIYGNRFSRRDTIDASGFAVSGNVRAYHDVDSCELTMACVDSIAITNQSSFPMSFQDIAFVRNLRFSIPPSVLPLSIGPGQRVYLPIVYQPIDARTEHDFDTLVLANDCGLVRLPVQGTPVWIEARGPGRCNIGVTAWTSRLPFEILTIAPNPVLSGQVQRLDIRSLHPSILKISVVDALGQAFADYTITLQQGVTEVFVPVPAGASGMYRVMLSNPDGIAVYNQTVVAP